MTISRSPRDKSLFDAWSDLALGETSDRISFEPDQPPDTERVEASPSDRFASGMHSTLVAAVPYEHMTQVACDARNLLGALMANVDWLKSGVDTSTSVGFAEALTDIDVCCERLNNVLESVLVGTRRGGLIAQRSAVSVGSVITGALGHVSKIAEAKRVRIRIAVDGDIVAMLDRALLTCGLASLTTQIINSSDVGTEIVAQHKLENGDIALSFLCAPTQNELDYQFCRLVAEWHGGRLMRYTDRRSTAWSFRGSG
jgi:hypothetical protein